MMMPAPKLYILTGLPYSGKTTLRKALVQRLRVQTVSVDEMMSTAFTLFEEPTNEEQPIFYNQHLDLDEWIITFLTGRQ